MTIDFTTDVGMVRLLISDVDEANLVFSTPEIEAFLALEGGSVKRAAAQAIDAGATNEALASKVLTDHQLKTDGAAVAKAMRDHAIRLREQAVADEDSFFEIVPARSDWC